jgi:YjbE family integral membrane protein
LILKISGVSIRSRISGAGEVLRPEQIICQQSIFRCNAGVAHKPCPRAKCSVRTCDGGVWHPRARNNVKRGTMIEAALTELAQVIRPEWWQLNFVALLNVVMIDLVLAGDNAIVVGLAASRVAPEIRSKVIFWGIAGAVILRILFAAITSQLLAIVGLTLFGGLLLLFVCWKMYQQLIDPDAHSPENQQATAGTAVAAGGIGFGAALLQIILADVTMSLDNVLAVAGAAKGSPMVLVIGLSVAIIMMAVASHYIAKLLVKYPAISWLGLAIIVYVSFDMIYRGSHEVACKTYAVGCGQTLWMWLTRGAT